MAPPTSPILQRTRSETAKNLADQESDGTSGTSKSQRQSAHNGNTFPSNINELLEPREASSRKETRKKKQQVHFNTNIQTSRDTSSPVFLLRPPEEDINSSDQSGVSTSDVNNNLINKQNSGPSIGQFPADHNNNNTPNVDATVLPEIEMIVDDQNDEINQPNKRKLENERIIAKLHVPIKDPTTIDEYRKFIKVVQNNILEDSVLQQENITALQTHIVTQKMADTEVAHNTKEKQNTNKIITGISLQATLISRVTLELLKEIPYQCDNVEYFFEEVITSRARQTQNNKNSQNRVVQIFNASLRLTTAVIKPFMRKYGEIVEDECYSRRPHVHVPNRQVIYITFKDANSVV